MSGDGAAILARGLAKSYGRIEAVRGVDLEVRRGEIYGFLGLNGAGKTTTIRMILGLVRPSSGEALIFGTRLSEDRERLLSRVGYLVESASAYPRLTVRENLDIQRRLTRAPKKAVGDIIELLGLGTCADRLAGKLSLGNRQRLSLARALLHSPELVILDEPANGLDPAGIIEVRALLRRLASEEGRTVFMSSHLLDEVEQLADRVGVVHKGKLVEELDIAALRERKETQIELEVDDAAAAEQALRSRLGLERITRSGERGLRVADPLAQAAEIARALVAAGVGLERLGSKAESLEEHFMRITGGAA